MIQQEIDFENIVHTKENNSFSEQILFDQYERLSKQCKLVYDLLKSGKRITVRQAVIEYGINHLPRRILDLKEALHIEIKSEMINGRFKEYFF